MLPANQGRDLAFPGGNAGMIRESYPGLESLRVRADADTVYARALETARQRSDWTITHTDASTRRFEGVAETALFRFRDDFAVRVRPAEGGAVVDMRSKSRDGKGDLGANAKRIRGFFAELRAALGG